jgi:catechol 2,3-dioxygenase-like lactoylglutathione lyase family enzyme
MAAGLPATALIQHVALEIRRELADECAEFYALIGFERVTPPQTLSERATWVERKGTQIHLLFSERPVTPPAGHVAVVVDDFNATFAALQASGHAPEHRPAHWGSPRAYVRDPAGNLVEMMAFPPP